MAIFGSTTRILEGAAATRTQTRLPKVVECHASGRVNIDHCSTSSFSASTERWASPTERLRAALTLLGDSSCAVAPHQNSSSERNAINAMTSLSSICGWFITSAELFQHDSVINSFLAAVN